MKLLTVSVLVCSMMALAGAAALQEAEKEHEAVAKIQEEEHHVDNRSTYCPDGWTKYNIRCFLFVPEALSWAQAEKNCLSMGAHLASVHGTEEYNQIKSMIEEKTHEYPETWIGGSDSQEDGVWLWSDGTPFIFSYWCSGEPTTQQCLQMNYGGDKCWDDTYCATTLPSVCAKKI